MTKKTVKKEIVAKGKFAVGDRVIMSAACHEWNKYDTSFKRRNDKYGSFGTVVGFSRDARNVRIKRDRLKTVEVWSARFWDVVTPKNIATYMPDPHLWEPVDENLQSWKPRLTGLNIDEEVCKQPNESLSSASQRKTANSSPQQQGDRGDNIKTAPKRPSGVLTVTLVRLDSQESRAAKLSIRERLSSAWQNLRHFVLGSDSKSHVE